MFNCFKNKLYDYSVPVIFEKKYCLLLLLFIAGCKEKYNPPLTAVGANYLVVEGLINTGQEATNIHLSRTTNLSEANTLTPELGAQVMVEGDNNVQYPLPERGAGVYSAGLLPLNTNNKYRLRINTSDGKGYVSDFVPVKPSPEIDSVSWKKEDDAVHISVSTHDPQNNSWYYRWEYEETWEYHSFYNSHLAYTNGLMRRRDSSNQIFTCWHTVNSPDIAIGSSIKLSQDLIPQHLLIKIPNGSEKTSIRYSILVKQYALTKEAFDFWTLLKKNTQQLGGTFDAQPSELTGNIHCLSNPQELVIGFISVGTITEKRIFIGWLEDLNPWKTFPPPDNCEISIVPNRQDLIDYYFGHFSVLFTPLDSVFSFTGMFVGYSKAEIHCADCREKAGVNTKPSYWP